MKLTLMTGCKQRAKYSCLHSCCVYVVGAGLSARAWLSRSPGRLNYGSWLRSILSSRCIFFKALLCCNILTPSAAVTLQSCCCVLMSLLSSEATRGAAEQQAFLQGRLCRGAPALPEARRPATPAGAQNKPNEKKTLITISRQQANQLKTEVTFRWDRTQISRKCFVSPSRTGRSIWPSSLTTASTSP